MPTMSRERRVTECMSLALRACEGKRRKKIYKAQTAGANSDFKESLRAAVHLFKHAGWASPALHHKTNTAATASARVSCRRALLHWEDTAVINTGQLHSPWGSMKLLRALRAVWILVVYICIHLHDICLRLTLCPKQAQREKFTASSDLPVHTESKNDVR